MIIIFPGVNETNITQLMIIMIIGIPIIKHPRKRDKKNTRKNKRTNQARALHASRVWCLCVVCVWCEKIALFQDSGNRGGTDRQTADRRTEGPKIACFQYHRKISVRVLKKPGFASEAYGPVNRITVCFFVNAINSHT